MSNRYLTAVVDRIGDDPSGLFCELWASGQVREITWGELGDRARAFGDTYRRHGVRSGDVVFLMLKHSVDLYPAFLGAMLIGAVPTFLPFPSPKQEPSSFWASQIAVFERTGSNLLVTYSELVCEVRQRMAGAVFQVITCADVDTVSGHLEAPLPDEDAVALLQHSSGTTGLKKGVMLSYSAIFHQIDSYAKSIEINARDCIIASWLPLYHDMGLIACFLMPMYLGVPIISLDAFEWTTRPALLLEAIEARRATHVWVPNFALAHMARAVPKTRRFQLGCLKAVIGCSEPNKPATVDQFIERFADDDIRQGQLHTCYAMAETVFAVTQSALDRAPRRLRALIENGAVIESDAAGAQEYLSNGTPIAGMELRVLHEGQLFGDGFAGEICVKTPYMFDGYFNDAERTQASFIDGFFKTGDLGFICDREIYIFGRVKELIIVNGRNYFANDVELAVHEADGVKKGRCVAFGVYVPSAGSEQIVVVAERDESQAPDAAVVRSIAMALNHRFGTTAGDIRIVEPGWLMKTTSGKISRAENAMKYQSSFRPEAQILVTMEAGS